MNSGGIAMTNAFVIAEETARQAVLFDAPDHTVAPLLDEVARHGWELIGLWLTHGDFDHIADYPVVKQRFPGAKILIHPLDAPLLQDQSLRFFPTPVHIPPVAPDTLVNGGDELHIGALRVRVLHTPGHAAGHVMYHLPDEKVLVGGDLIIGGSVGRTDLPGSDPAKLQESIRRVMQLPDDTHLLPGHGSPSTLGEQRRSNPYVQAILRGETL
jgi:glyoxylase-like metal-dependent hydrolase (beta-lactamase superfamily II)